MKTITIFLLMMYISSVVLSAQPTISTNEYYHIGDVIEMVNCNAADANAGAAGEAVTWDFSSLPPLGGVSTTTVAIDTSSVFITSNLLITLPNGFTEYMNENSSDSYINGIYNKATNILYNYNNYHISKRPFTYLTTYVDTYKLNITTPFTFGSGYLTETGDAYGTLKLPTGTYNNVLRIKEQQIETDTAGDGSIAAFTTTISYLWFDNMHAAPLFRIDSVTGTKGNSNTAMYFTMTTGVNILNGSQSSYYGHIDDNTLFITGSFEYSKIYEVGVFSIIGTEIFRQDFIAYSNSERFDIARQVSPGIYMISITPKNDPGLREVIKVVKQ